MEPALGRRVPALPRPPGHRLALRGLHQPDHQRHHGDRPEDQLRPKWLPVGNECHNEPDRREQDPERRVPSLCERGRTSLRHQPLRHRHQSPHRDDYQSSPLLPHHIEPRPRCHPLQYPPPPRVARQHLYHQADPLRQVDRLRRHCGSQHQHRQHQLLLLHPRKCLQPDGRLRYQPQRTTPHLP